MIADVREARPLPGCEMSSLGESVVERLARRDAAGVIALSSKRLVRSCPSGLRCDSSNNSPLHDWAVGTQMVALNYQTAGDAMQASDTLFTRNGGCGYALKPIFMRSGATEVPSAYHPTSYAPHGYSLCVRVISGMNLPKENGDKQGEVIDPSVKVGLQCSTGTVQTKTTGAIRKNGYNPIWDELFEFKIKNLDFALLCFTVYDVDFLKPDYIAHGGVCVKNLREGYRLVPLLDADGVPIQDSGLLCHFELKQPHKPPPVVSRP